MKLTLSAKLVISVFFLVFVSLLILFFSLTYHVSAAYKNNLIADTSATAELLASMLSAPLVFEQKDGAGLILSALEATPSVTYSAVYDAQQGGHHLFAGYGKQESDAIYRQEALAEFTATSLHMVRPILLDGSAIGWLHLQTSLRPLQIQLFDLYNTMAIALIIALSGAALFAVMISRSLLNPLLLLRATSTQIAQTKDYSLRVEQKSEDEIGHLVAAFNSMLEDIAGFIQEKNAKQQQVLELNEQLERKVTERTQQLESSMLQLNNTVLNLQLAQKQMVEQEKLASLGSLVAGVAHEINTPVGVAVTMSSTFSEKMNAFLQKVQTGQLRRAEFDEFEHDSKEGLELLQKSLNKAAQLIQSFKQVAVDQTSEERRIFKLSAVIDELMRTLRFQLKNKEIAYQVEVAEDIWMDSYPGPLGQVITNLFNNAVIHGFEGNNQGLILIQVQAVDDKVTIQVKDNGVGIPTKLIHRVFEPFVTTKLGQGGSGLGLHIVHNIVVNILGGDIRVQSNAKQGCCFTIQLPRVAPLKETRRDL